MKQLKKIVLNRHFIKLAMLLLLTVGLASQVAQAETLDKIVAVVNDGVITQSQLDQQMQMATEQMQQTHVAVPPMPEFRKQILQHMIDTQLQLQLAKKEGINVDDASVDAAIANIAKNNGLTIAELQSKVAEQGLSYSKYRQDIQEQMIIGQVQQREVAPRVVVTDQEITDFMPKVKQQMRLLAKQPQQQAVMYHLIDYTIALPDSPSAQQKAAALAKAQATLTRLRAGENVQQVDSMNDLGWRKVSDLPDIFAREVPNMHTGGIAGPISAPNGYHLLKLVGVQGGTSVAPVTFDSTLTHARHILIKSNPLQTDAQVKARLEKLRASIIAGADFAQLAEANSQDPGSASKGGDLGWVSQGVLDPAFEAQMNQLKPGQISEPFKSSFGWHIVQVLERKKAPNDQTYLREQAKKIIYQQKANEALQNWLQQLRSQSYVNIKN